jgi:hypothetical protein
MTTITTRDLKRLIERDDLDALQAFYMDISGEDDIDWPGLFKDCYLHACLKKKPRIATWMENELFSEFDPIAQIALRHTFAYGRYLLRKST